MFVNFVKEIQKNLTKMCATGTLYVSQCTGHTLWATYLANLSKEDNPIFRDPQSNTHSCNHCRNFIQRYGNLVAIDDDLNILTLFDNITEEMYVAAATQMNLKLKESVVGNAFVETFDNLNSLPYEKVNKANSTFRLGIDANVKVYNAAEAALYGVVKEGEAKMFHHFFLNLPKAFLDVSGKSIASVEAVHKSNYDVFERGMREISLDTLHLVRDLINQESLLDGKTHLFKVEAMIKLSEEYQKLSASQKLLWCWKKSYNFNLAKFRNELIGTLCVDLSEGMELNKACATWNKRVDPVNYMKAKSPITQNQIKEAQKFVEDNGYVESFDRRFATISDIKVSDILHITSDDGKVKKVSLFDSVKSTSTRHKKSEFDKVEEVGIDKFMSDILPSCTSVEVYLENRMEGNLVSLTTANVKESKPIFKWNNNYSWTYNGNLAGKSQLAEMVEAKGGRTDGVFRFTHSWNEIERNESLMDLHVFMPGCQIPTQYADGPYVTGRRVGWNHRQDVLSGGIQDVDYTNKAPMGYVPVENITFPTLSKMPEGKYTCAINNWSFRGSGGKGRAEIAFEGNSYQYIYPATRNDEWVIIAEVTLKNGKFSIDHKLPLSGETTRDLYDLETNNFHKVNLMCLSPNHWESNVGNKHYFFFLEGCQSPTSLRSFHIENLIPELADHRKVLENLANVTMVESISKQLSGVGFNATVRDEVILRVSGTHKRLLKVKF